MRGKSETLGDRGGEGRKTKNRERSLLEVYEEAMKEKPRDIEDLNFLRNKADRMALPELFKESLKISEKEVSLQGQRAPVQLKVQGEGAPRVMDGQVRKP